MSSAASPSMLHQFSAPTRQWFEGVFAAPTPAQEAAWSAIGAGHHALVVAPTGSGKTLAAFLWAIDRLFASEVQPNPKERTRVIYVSPMKALAVDVERNLRAPLSGITAVARANDLELPELTVAVRSGDTPALERQRFLRHPSDILITTPESLYLLLTSRARELFSGVNTVIVDEVHAIAGTKRGAHLALSLERLDELLRSQSHEPAQRVGLSATVRPPEAVATFLGGRQSVQVVQPPTNKKLDVSVVVPVADLRELGGPGKATPDDELSPIAPPTVWPHVESKIVDLIDAHHSTIVFANSRRLAERLSARLNEEWFRRQTDQPLTPVGADNPAEVMAQAGSTRAHLGPAFARAHHGSVSREQRGHIEEALKRGELPAVVATSSLELGIDMGAVDLVVQVEPPPSVASGLQRIGRSGHHVDGVSQGVIFPKHRGDLVPTAVTVERMLSGEIEHLSVPKNPLDVLAQQIVAMVAMDDWGFDDLLTLVRRAAPYHLLPDRVFESVLDMLAGRYPSDAFAELRPRLVWDRDTNLLTARPGAHRLAVINGGTIPDRGLYGVFLAGAEGEDTRGGKRVGELDEEMVYESRVGDVFALGATSWRIEDITHDRVLVSPAPGQAGKLPFWHGDALGRPAELGAAIGQFVREVDAADDAAARARLAASGLDEWASDNLIGYLREQREACGVLPDDKTVVLERFRDEIGDWRVVLHSPLGGRITTPWSLAIAARISQSLGVDVQVMPSDDGIVLRLPDTSEGDGEGDGEGDDESSAPPIHDLLTFDPGAIEAAVTEAVAGSALFASRFRECASRALLLPRRRPDRRTPLWQQRQRSAQLLSVASEHGEFPIVLETMRECLQEVFDLPGLRALMRDIEEGSVRVVDAHTSEPSPFARSMLFSYVGAFLYEGDAPLAERRAQALALDTSLLAELLGEAELRELLDPDALTEVENELQRLAPERGARDAEDAADMLRILGPLSTADAQVRGVQPRWLEELAARRRIAGVRIAGESVWAAVEDIARLRDALGVPPPMGISTAFLEPVADPLGDIVSRYARTHGPFTSAEAATSLGLGRAVIERELAHLQSRGRCVVGEFRPGGSGQEWCDADVLRRIRRRSLAKLRKDVEPVPTSTYARFLPQWQNVGGNLRGIDGVLEVIEQLQGVSIPLSALESLVLPARIRDYSPAMLDEVLASGMVRWAGRGRLPGNDGWVCLAIEETAAAVLAPWQAADVAESHAALLSTLGVDAGLFFRTLAEHVPDPSLRDVLWDLVWDGRVTNDTFAPMRAYLSAHQNQGTAPRLRTRRRNLPGVRKTATATLTGGRWSRLPEAADLTPRLHEQAQAMLARYGILTRGSVAVEHLPGGFAASYRVLAAMEEAGRTRRGYFVEGLGASQFGSNGAINALRANADSQKSNVVVLASADPANPFGAALPWPERRAPDQLHLPGRKAGSLVVIADGQLRLYVERGGRSLLAFTPNDSEGALGQSAGEQSTARLTRAIEALVETVRSGRFPRMRLDRVNGGPVMDSELATPLQEAGFQVTPRGLVLRPG